MELFAKVYAQTVDAIAQPTIPFTQPGDVTPTPFVTISPTTVTQDPSITLFTDKTQLGLNEKVTIRVIINTNSKLIKSFKFSIKYNPEQFKITDTDTSVPNVQINFKDTFFISAINEVDTANGIINISASTDQGTAAITSRDVADFELTTLKEGFTPVTLDIQNSNLLDANNIDILKVVSAPIDFTITSAPITFTPTIPVVPPTGMLPRNGFFDEFGAANAFISGTILIVIGTYLYRLQKHAKKKI